MVNRQHSECFKFPVHVRWLASAVGQIISMSLVIGPVARLHTRTLYTVINMRCSWADRLLLSDEAREDLAFWKSCLSYFNGQSIWFLPGVTRVVYSDASSSGYGGCHVVEVGLEVAHGQWSEYEASLSSTWRDLKAVAQVLCAFSCKLSGHRVKWFTDNQNIARIVESGSRKQHLQVGLQLQLMRVSLTGGSNAMAGGCLRMPRMAT